ncbi:MAG: alpha/beta fold hydrolase [Elainellaceae cyanobacterium]
MTATIVLVHGTWHGGGCWRKVKPLLQKAGHIVLSPSLMGMGEHIQMLNPQIDLQLHIQNLVLLLEYEDLQDVVLVGHSYAGMVITGAVDYACDRLAQLVYLDAFLPEPGKCLKDYADNPGLDELVQTQGDGWLLPWKAMFEVEHLGVTNPEDIAWMTTRLCDQPYATVTQPVQFSEETIATLPRTFISTSSIPLFAAAAARAQAQAQGFRYYELPAAGHDAMISQPQALSDILLELI